MSIESLSDKAKTFYVTQEEIDATHPMNDGVSTYAEDAAAMELVHERHGKRGYTFTGFVDELRSAATPTPTIPTGYRLVPVDDVTLREAAEEALDLLEHADPQHGITTQLRNVLSASPSTGGV